MARTVVNVSPTELFVYMQAVTKDSEELDLMFSEIKGAQGISEDDDQDMPDIRVRQSGGHKWEGWTRHTNYESFSKNISQRASGVKASSKDTKTAFVKVKELAIKRKRAKGILNRLTRKKTGVPSSSALGEPDSTPPDLIKSKVVSAPALSPMSVETDLPSNLRIEVLRQFGEHRGTIVALHPHRCTSGEFTSDSRYFRRLMEAGFRIVLPNARVRLERWRQREVGANLNDAEGITQPSWFLYPDETEKQDKTTMMQTAAELEELLVEERYLLDRDSKQSTPRPLLILGESQGGVQATATYLKTKVKVQGLMCLVSHPPCEIDRNGNFHQLMLARQDVNNYADKKKWPMIFFNYYGKAGGDEPNSESDEWWSDNTFHFKLLVQPSIASFKELMGDKCRSFHFSGGDHQEKKTSPTVFRQMYEEWCNTMASSR